MDREVKSDGHFIVSILIIVKTAKLMAIFRLRKEQDRRVRP